MHPFDVSQSTREHLNAIEDKLKSLRDQVDRPTQVRINNALRQAIPFRDLLWEVDKSLEQMYHVKP